jgi:hypothetical protein
MNMIGDLLVTSFKYVLLLLLLSGHTIVRWYEIFVWTKGSKIILPLQENESNHMHVFPRVANFFKLRTVLGYYCRHAWPNFFKEPKLGRRMWLLLGLKKAHSALFWNHLLPSADRDELNFPVMHASLNQLFPRTELYFFILASGLSSSQSSTLLLLPAGDRWRHAEIKLPATDQNISYYWSWPIIFRSQRL